MTDTLKFDKVMKPGRIGHILYAALHGIMDQVADSVDSAVVSSGTREPAQLLNGCLKAGPAAWRAV